MGQDRQLLGGVAAVDVHGRIRLGKAELLGLGQGVGVGLAESSICVRMKLLVPLSIPWIDWIWLATSD